jgi:hypothetical protein
MPASIRATPANPASSDAAKRVVATDADTFSERAETLSMARRESMSRIARRTIAARSSVEPTEQTASTTLRQHPLGRACRYEQLGLGGAINTS